MKIAIIKMAIGALFGALHFAVRHLASVGEICYDFPSMLAMLALGLGAGVFVSGAVDILILRSADDLPEWEKWLRE